MLKNRVFAFFIVSLVVMNVGASPDQRIAHIIEKSEKYRNNLKFREKIQQKRVQVKALIERYKNAEKIRTLEQEKFNNHVLYQLDIPPGDPLFSIALRNSDFGKGLFVLLDWGIEWCLYQRMLNCWADFVSNYIMQHRKELTEALTAVQEDDENSNSHEKVNQLVYAMNGKEFIGQMVREFLPSMAAYLCMSQLSDSLRHHYLLDRSSAQNILMLLIANLVGLKDMNPQGPISLFELIESKLIKGIPSTMIKSGVLDEVNNSLKDFKLFDIKLFPDWTTSTSYLISKRIAFMGLFMHWSIKSFFQPLLCQSLVNNRKKLLENPNPTEIKTIIFDDHKKLFPRWLTLKSEKYSLWQTTVNVAIMVPTLTGKIYSLVKKFRAIADGATAQPAIADQNEAT